MQKNRRIHEIQKRKIELVYLLKNYFFHHFIDNFSTLLLRKINGVDMFNMVDYFNFDLIWLTPSLAWRECCAESKLVQRGIDTIVCTLIFFFFAFIFTQI